MNEERFIEDHKAEIKNLLAIEKRLRECEEAYKRSRKKLCEEMEKSGLRIIRIPELNIRIQMNGGTSSTKINRRRLEKKYPNAFHDCLEFNCSDPFILIYAIDKNIKKGINLLKVRKS